MRKEHMQLELERSMVVLFLFFSGGRRVCGWVVGLGG